MAYTIKIDLKSQTPVYKQLINSVETAIHNGEYRYGDLLPSMNELSAVLDISKETVKKAYSILRNKGYIDGNGQESLFAHARQGSYQCHAGKGLLRFIRKQRAKSQDTGVVR